MPENEAKWTCHKCSTENDPDFTHCRKCGEAKPEEEAKTCKSCGHDCTGYFSCPQCGSKEFLQL